jgi:hypothetical protein
MGMIFLISILSRLVLGHTQPPIQLVPGALPMGVKESVHEANHLSLSSAEVKNGGAIPPLSNVFKAQYLIT